MEQQMEHQLVTLEEARAIIERAAWTFAKTTAGFAPHEYVVKGWDRDDVTEQEFWQLADLIKRTGRQEIWTPPDEWVRRWGGRPMKNRYLYLGDYAYWFTWPRKSPAMLNREHVSVQEKTPTRRPVDEQPDFDPVAFIAEAPWKFASSMAHIPHEYVLRGQTVNERDFNAFDAFLQANGFKATWVSPGGRRMPNTYLHFEGFRFWRIEHVMNREKLPGQPLELPDGSTIRGDEDEGFGTSALIASGHVSDPVVSPRLSRHGCDCRRGRPFTRPGPPTVQATRLIGVADEKLRLCGGGATA
jgi:hypothetical protein